MPIRFLHITHTYLKAGSWADVFDILRANSTPEWRFDNPIGGGDLQDLSQDQMDSIFGPPSPPGPSDPQNNEYMHHPSKAEMYIRKSIDRNPLRGIEGY